jgi:hypothetical protein
MTLQRPAGITPCKQLLKPSEIGWLRVHMTQRAAFVFDTQERTDGELTLFSGLLKLVDVIGNEGLVFVDKQLFELPERCGFFGDQPCEMLAANGCIHA